MIGDKMDTSVPDPELERQRQAVGIFDLYDQIMRNALGMQRLLRDANISVDPDKSRTFNELLVSLHDDAVSHANQVSKLIIQIESEKYKDINNRRKQMDRRIVNRMLAQPKE